MKIELVLMGKTNNNYLQLIMNEYKKRLNHYFNFEEKIILDLKNVKNLNKNERKKKEGEKILKTLGKNDFIILLDEKGKEYSSLEFAEEIEKKFLLGIKRIVFIIGGAFGFSEAMYKRANQKISLSKMTFSHQIIRPIFLEQLYRAMTIINKEPYHKE